MIRGVLLGCAIVSLCADLATGATSTRPAVALADTTPLTVRGLGFKPSEIVVVRVGVRGGPQRSKNITAGGRGGFLARFRTLDVGRCSFYFVRATGSRGSRASISAHPLTCGPAP